MRVVALCSGGLDSLVSTWDVAQHHELVMILTAHYGQRAAIREIETGTWISQLLQAPFEIVELRWLGEISRDALTSQDKPLPEVSPADLDDQAAASQRLDQVWVANRNGVLINVAAAYAEALGADAIVMGLNSEEGAIFPDNTLEFARAAENLFRYSTRNHPRIIAPTASMTKAEIVRYGLRIRAPLRLVWSCYDGGPDHCWRCESCLRLKRALEEAGAWPEWKPAHR